MSALPPKADMVQHDRDVRFVPKADIRHCSKTRPEIRGVHTPVTFFGALSTE
jgi:hypothetical protein